LSTDDRDGCLQLRDVLCGDFNHGSDSVATVQRRRRPPFCDEFVLPAFLLF
jgi:hypothetical protein